jgi:hypothetical protein
VETSLFFIVTLVVACALPIALGLPVAVRLGAGQGAGRLGFAAAIGMAMILIACRGVQMWLPIGIAAPWMAAAAVVVLVLLWTPVATRRRIARFSSVHRRTLVALFGVGTIVVMLINVPIIARDALQFEGSRNADSFTFTSNARYMIGHSFFGAPDFSPKDPVYNISRSYFGRAATQPRPAAEGYLAWLSALWGKDPLYLYNAVQGAGLLLAGLSVLALVRQRRVDVSQPRPWMTAIVVFACPALAYVAINSNFANNLNLAPATAFVALALVRNTRVRVILGGLFVASLLGGYPELLVFIVACRALAILIETAGGAAGCVRKGVSLGMELLLGCMAVPWAAKAAVVVYATTLGIGVSHDPTLRGNMTEGVPLFVLALTAFVVCVKRRWDVRAGELSTSALYASVLAIFAAAQLVMLIKGFAYGGFRLAGYFVTLHLGVLVGCVVEASARESERRVQHAVRRGVTVLAALMMIKSSLMIEKSWRVAGERYISTDLIALGNWLDQDDSADGFLIGQMPQPFYYGMWINYLTSTRLVYDLSQGEAAGYLTPYLRSLRPVDLGNIERIITLDVQPDCGDELCKTEQSFGRAFVTRVTKTPASM